jgi:hypothetical protein
VVVGGKTIRQTERRVLIMAVLIEALSVVIHLETIADKYPGGVEQYIKDCPNRNLCMDDEIVRVGFMTGYDAYDFIGSLERFGFRFVVDDEYDEVVLVDQFRSIDKPCDWLEYGKLVIFKGDLRIAICLIKGSAIDSVGFPAGWVYENSLSKLTIVIDSGFHGDRLTFLRHENGFDYYLDALTEKEVFIERSIRRNANA